MQIKFILFSDLHLERNDKSYPFDFLISQINEKLDRIRQDGFEPHILAPGDISNGLLSFDFLEDINCKIFFTPGNHEYWANDFYDTSCNFISNLPRNVVLLNNSFCDVGEYLIIGSTLWTDSGLNLNKDISIDASSRMNDMSYINAKNWYNEENISRLYESYSSHSSVDEKIKLCKWNYLVEKDENDKAWYFINDLSHVLNMINLAESLKEILIDSDISSSKDEYLLSLKDKLDYSNVKNTWSSFVNNIRTIASSYKIEFEKKIYYGYRLEQRSSIFEKAKVIRDINRKKIIMMTHHLPFYEEFLVGYNDIEQKQSLNSSLDPDIFLVRKGKDYPTKNYLNKSLRGEIPRFSDISHIVNYSNNGSEIIDEYILKNTSIWVHGHEHYFRYQNFLKNIFFCTNPSGQPIREFGRAIYSKNSTDSSINALLDRLMMEIPNLNDIEIKKDNLMIEVLRCANLKSLKEIMTKFGKISHEILLISTDLLKTSMLDNSRKSAKDLNEKLHFWIDCYRMIKEELIQYLTELEVFYLSRTDPNFNFQSLALNFYKPRQELFKFITGYIEPPEIGVENSWLTIAKKSFISLATVKISEKNVSKLDSLLSQEDISIIKIISSLQSNDEITNKIEENWSTFFSKLQSK